MQKQSLLLILLLFAFSCHLINCKSEKERIVNSIIQYGALEGMYLGPTDSISPQWKNYEALKGNLSENELIQLCEHKNPIVRCYSFKALTETCSLEAYGVLLGHLSDTIEFNRIYGCIPDKDRVSDFFLDQVGYDKLGTSKYTLTEEQYRYIDSLILFSDEIKQRSWMEFIEYRSGFEVLKRVQPLPHLKNRIKYLVTLGVYEALPALARYKDLADTSLFINFLLDDEFSYEGRCRSIYIRESIRFFPHPSFYPVLKELLMKEVGTNKIYDDYVSSPLYEALVQYPTTETKKLLEKTLKMSEKERRTRSQRIYYALKRTPNIVFEGLTNFVPQE